MKKDLVEQSNKAISEQFKSGQRLLTPAEAAEYIGGLKEQTLAIWRTTRRYNLPYIKCGRLVRYRIEDLDAFLAERMRGGAA